MGASLNDPQVQKDLAAARKEAEAAATELKLDIAQGVIDAAGIVDPTPISDAVGGLMSAARGDWIGAGLSVVSMLPYAGDAVGKTAKGARLIARMAKVRKRMADALLAARQAMGRALKKDAAAIRAKRAAAKGQKIEEAIVAGCPVGGNRFGTQSPKNGWVSGERGHGTWDPSKSGLDPEKVKKIESVTGKGNGVKFKDGSPDFSEYTYKTKNADGQTVDASVEIQLSPTGNRDQDFIRAREAMAEKMGVDSFDEPPGWTWHHKEDGTTMELVPSNLHGNVPHSGGVSIAKDPSY